MDDSCEDEHIVGLKKSKSDTLITALDEGNQQNIQQILTVKLGLICDNYSNVHAYRNILSDRTINISEIEMIMQSEWRLL